MKTVKMQPKTFSKLGYVFLRFGLGSRILLMFFLQVSCIKSTTKIDSTIAYSNVNSNFETVESNYIIYECQCKDQYNIDKNDTIYFYDIFQGNFKTAEHKKYYVELFIEEDKYDQLFGLEKYKIISNENDKIKMNYDYFGDSKKTQTLFDFSDTLGTKHIVPDFFLAFDHDVDTFVLYNKYFSETFKDTIFDYKITQGTSNNYVIATDQPQYEFLKMELGKKVGKISFEISVGKKNYKCKKTKKIIYLTKSKIKKFKDLEQNDLFVEPYFVDYFGQSVHLISEQSVQSKKN
jgi:hypothetical protein